MQRQVVVAQRGAPALRSLTAQDILQFIREGDPQLREDPENFKHLISEDLATQLTCVQSVGQSIGNGADQFQTWQDMDWPEFKVFLDWLARSSTSISGKIPEGVRIWERIIVHKDCPMDPRRTQEFAIQIGEAQSYARKRNFDTETEREVVTHILRQMKDSKKNKTLLRMADEIKNDKAHTRGLKQFLQAILEKVARQAESLRSFHEQQLEQFVNPLAEPDYKERRGGDRKRDRGDFNKDKDPKRPKREQDRTSGSTCNACGRQGHKWRDCRLRLGEHPDANHNPTRPWADSEKGKAWATHASFPSKVLPVKYNLGGEVVKLKGETPQTYVLPINSDSDKNTLRCKIIKHKNPNPREVEAVST